MAESNLESFAAIFVVRDLQKSIAFYRDVLGFTVAFTYGEPPFYAGEERGGVLIHLHAADRAKRQPGEGGVYVFAEDVDALHAEFKSRSAEIPAEPRDYPYGMRDFDVRDPDGNQLSFGMQSKPKP